ncbi:MBL fold metallo-hydrolase, partial [Nonomuraea fuscirosea]
VAMFGPGGRGSLAPLAGEAGAEPTVINRENPTPGLADTVEYLYSALAADLNDNIRDSLKPDPHALLRVRDIELPDGLDVRPDTDPAPRMDPFVVFEDDRVRVRATLVHHPPAFPAFGYRFDTEDGSVVFSGDTSACDNLVQLAAGADVLVHEVIDPQWVDRLLPTPRTPEQQAKRDHLIRSHTPVGEVGPLAERAGVKTLVLTHLSPTDNPRERWLTAGNGFSGRLVVGDDLLQVGVG